MYVQRIKAKEPVDESWKKQIVHSVNNYLKAHNPGIEIVDLDEDRLTAWMGEHVAGSGPIRSIVKFPGGQSNPTFWIGDGARVWQAVSGGLCEEPTRVPTASCCGAVAASTSAWCIWASVRETTRRVWSPATIPRTPTAFPASSSLLRAVRPPSAIAARTDGGTSAFANRSATAWNAWTLSSVGSSSNKRKCSPRRPLSPGAVPRGIDRIFRTK